MKKRILCAAVLMALLCVSASAGSLGGDDLRIRGSITGTLLYGEEYVSPREGPGFDYPAVPSNLRKGDRVKLYSRYGDGYDPIWVMAEANGRRVYLFQQDSVGNVAVKCDLNKLPLEALTMDSPWQCSCYETLYLRSGPGANYPYTGFAMSVRENAWVVLVEGDWALVECTNAYDDSPIGEIYFRRGWARFDQLIY